MEKPTLSIIILSYNTSELLLLCIQSIISQYKKQLEQKQFEIIVVDNNSTDTTISDIKKNDSHRFIRLIENKENTGFSKGCNIGAQRAKGKFLLFLNSDTQIKDDGFEKMVEFLRKNETVAIVGAKMKNEDGSSQPSAGKFYTLWNALLLLAGAERFGHLRFSPTHVTDADWVSGASLMIRKNIFDQLLGFDEKIFMYMEDMEFCYRVKKEGKRVVFFPDIDLLHVSHGSSNRGFAIIQIYKGLLYFYKKHMPFYQYVIVQFVMRVKALCLLFVGKISDNTYLSQTYEKAFHVS